MGAKRELQEETGLQASALTKLGEMYMAPGFCNEYMHFYLASGLSVGDTQMDHDESIECHQYQLSQIGQMIREKKIIDAKTIVGYYMLLEHIG